MSYRIVQRFCAASIVVSPSALFAQVSPDVRARALIGEERYEESWEALQRLVTDEPEFTPCPPQKLDPR